MTTKVKYLTDRDAITAMIREVEALQERVVELRPRNPALSWVLNSLKTTHYDLAVALKEAK